MPDNHWVSLMALGWISFSYDPLDDKWLPATKSFHRDDNYNVYLQYELSDTE